MGRALLIWGGFTGAVLWALIMAATSPLLAWREPVYIASGLAGVAGLALIVAQPLLAAGALPGLDRHVGRRVHRWSGVLLIVAVLVHVVGLWITSPPDVVDALLLRSPTPFSVWGVLAMWAVFAAAALAVLRSRGRVRPRIWRLGHTGLVVLVSCGTIAHALLIQGTMGWASKLVLCLLALAALGKAVLDLRVWTLLRRRRV